MSTPEDGYTVRYSAKELFAQINDKMDSLGLRVESKIDVLAEKLDAKADHQALVDLEVRVTDLETVNSERQAISGWLKATVVLLLSVVALLVPVALHYLP